MVGSGEGLQLGNGTGQYELETTAGTAFDLTLSSVYISPFSFTLKPRLANSLIAWRPKCTDHLHLHLYIHLHHNCWTYLDSSVHDCH